MKEVTPLTAPKKLTLKSLIEALDEPLENYNDAVIILRKNKTTPLEYLSTPDKISENLWMTSCFNRMLLEARDSFNQVDEHLT